MADDRAADDARLARTLVLVMRLRQSEPDEVVRRVVAELGEHGMESLSRLVGAHHCLRLKKRGDGRRLRACLEATQQEMDGDPSVVLQWLDDMLGDLRRNAAAHKADEQVVEPVTRLRAARAQRRELQVEGGAR